MARTVEFTLDGRPASAPEGELLVRAAARHGVFIPPLYTRFADVRESIGHLRGVIESQEYLEVDAAFTRVT